MVSASLDEGIGSGELSRLGQTGLVGTNLIKLTACKREVSLDVEGAGIVHEIAISITPTVFTISTTLILGLKSAVRLHSSNG